jgi:hypothetical protein
MAPETVPEDLKRFILTSIPSIPFLEALLLLRAARRDWAVEEIAHRLYLSEKSAADALEGLCATALVGLALLLYGLIWESR